MLLADRHKPWDHHIIQQPVVKITDSHDIIDRSECAYAYIHVLMTAISTTLQGQTCQQVPEKLTESSHSEAGVWIAVTAR